MADTNADLSRALVHFLHFNERYVAFSKSDPDRLLKEFGPSKGPELVARVQSLIQEANDLPIDWSKHTLASASHEFRRIICERHPELSDEAIRALKWKFDLDHAF
jgi:hypothetical protein